MRIALDRTFIYLTILSTFQWGCKGGEGFTGGVSNKKKEPAVVEKASETFTIGSEGSPKVDLAFFLDTSDSMVQEYSALLQGLQNFVNRIATGSSGLDAQVIIVGNLNKIKLNLQDMTSVDLRNSEVNSHSGLWNAYHLLAGNTDKVPSGKLQLRTDATKELVFLTDDDAKNITADNLLPYLNENKAKHGSVHINGFVGLSTSQVTSTCKISNIGTSYIKLGQDSTFGGLIADVCESDWSELLTELADSVRDRAGKAIQVTLKGVPKDEKRILVLVDGQEFIDFTYDKTKRKLTLDPKKLGDGSHKVVVSY
ncbi:MAG: hypothetical protein NT027_12630 [Proteobacteria bacterium]|nr:hypothetical protein [Pseudomonadota bacterium]